MANARIRRSRQRRAVNRGDRVKPTPETLAKLRPWTLRQLLIAGPDDGGIDADELTAADEIVAAFRVITVELGYRPLIFDRVSRAVSGMSPKAERLATIYLAWATAFQRLTHCRPHVVVEWIEDQRTIDSGAVSLLRRGLALWDRMRSEHDRARRAQRSAAPQFVASGH
jgi:hypothetical protein